MGYPTGFLEEEGIQPGPKDHDMWSQGPQHAVGRKVRPALVLKMPSSGAAWLTLADGPGQCSGVFVTGEGTEWKTRLLLALHYSLINTPRGLARSPHFHSAF